MSEYEPRGELPIRDWAPFILPADLPGLVRQWEQFNSSDDPNVTMEWTWSKTMRTVTAFFVKMNTISPGLRGSIGSLTDITQDKLRAKEQQQRLFEEQRRTAEALEAKRQQELLSKGLKMRVL